MNRGRVADELKHSLSGAVFNIVSMRVEVEVKLDCPGRRAKADSCNRPRKLQANSHVRISA